MEWKGRLVRGQVEWEEKNENDCGIQAALEDFVCKMEREVV